jgi:hypothetical protein
MSFLLSAFSSVEFFVFKIACVRFITKKYMLINGFITKSKPVILVKIQS